MIIQEIEKIAIESILTFNYFNFKSIRRLKSVTEKKHQKAVADKIVDILKHSINK